MSKRVRALQTVHGSYPCSQGEKPDHIQAEVEQNDQGYLVKVMKGYMKFTLIPEHYRAATNIDKEEDQKRVNAGGESRLTPDGLHILVPADPEFIDLPDEIADELAGRGIVEIVPRKASPKAA